jgi:hypothetical protein
VARVAAGLTAALFVLASLLGALHEATTSHVRCATHGELVDSDGPLAPSASAQAGTAQPAITGAEPSARGHGDDHCLVAAAARTSRIAPRTLVLAAAPAALAAGDPPRAPLIAPASTAPGYRIAPKTSPPA